MWTSTKWLRALLTVAEELGENTTDPLAAEANLRRATSLLDMEPQVSDLLYTGLDDGEVARQATDLRPANLCRAV